MKKILAIALDAAEPSLIEKWTEDGSLPVLKRLREYGRYGRLTSSAQWMTGSSWPTFYTGKNPANHGFYNYLVWNSQKLVTEPPTPDRMPLRPFWRDMKDPGGPRSIVIDIPLTYGVEPFNGMELISFATHDALVPFAGYPPEFVDAIRSRYGKGLMSRERYELQSKGQFFNTRDEMIRIVGQVGTLCKSLVEKQDWDFFLASFSSIHRAGHRLWKTHNIKGRLTMEEQAEALDALRQVYIACDREIGKIIDLAGLDATVFVFSLHGMGDNSTRTAILPEMLNRVLHAKRTDHHPPQSDPLSRLRGWIPLSVRSSVKSALPVQARHWLTAFWRQNREPWGSTRAFSMLADTQGWIRINLRGREAQGIVNPGQEFDDLCEEIATGLRTYVDQDTREPLIKSIVRSSQVLEGEKLDMLPDLIILWNETPAHKHREIFSPQYGTIPWPTPGRNPEGRSGNHLFQGMLIAAGPDIQPGTIVNGHILDLAPTILAWLEQPVPPEMEGKILPLLNTHQT